MPPGSVLPRFPAVDRMAARQVAAPPGFAHGGVGGLPQPVDPAQRITDLDKHDPDPCEDYQLTPALAVPMHGAVVAKRRGQLVP
jgi:hypothetical protein